jgi:hypothetical protein
MSPCDGIKGCWHTGEVNVGYYPYMVNIPLTQIRLAPDDAAKAIQSLTHEQRFGVQSTRNPSNRKNPARRGAVNGYVFGYSNRLGTSGWVRIDALVSDTSGELWADGPAGADFQVGLQDPPIRKTHSSCAGHDGKDELRKIGVEDTYLRYAPQSTPYWYLVGGDHVKIKWRSRGKYCCVVVTQSEVCPRTTRGWIPYASLEKK